MVIDNPYVADNKKEEDSTTQIQIAAAATLCNLVMDFNPMKQYMIERNGVKKLVHFCLESMDSTLRINAITTLKNLSFRADQTVKETMVRDLTFDTLFRLLNDEEVEVQRHAMNLIRNMLFGPMPNNFLEQLLRDATLMNIIQQKLTQSQDVGVLLQIIFVLSNIAGIGTEQHRRSIMTPTIMNPIFLFLKHQNKDVRAAVIWLLINLTWDIVDENDTEEKRIAWEHRIRILQEYRCKDQLEAVIRSDTEIDVRERARQAIEHMNNRGAGQPPRQRHTISE